uniref:Uncharacterized protein n=1 Tax=Cacopsylla melanoneura TaxID=428564 RepID=A0A8D9BAQ0_9HEMI
MTDSGTADMVFFQLVSSRCLFSFWEMYCSPLVFGTWFLFSAFFFWEMLYQLPCSSFASNLVCLEKSSKLKLSPGSPELSFHSVLFLSIFSASLILSSSFCSLNREIIPGSKKENF